MIILATNVETWGNNATILTYVKLLLSLDSLSTMVIGVTCSSCLSRLWSQLKRIRDPLTHVRPGEEVLRHPVEFLVMAAAGSEKCGLISCILLYTGQKNDLKFSPQVTFQVN